MLKSAGTYFTEDELVEIRKRKTPIDVDSSVDPQLSKYSLLPIS